MALNHYDPLYQRTKISTGENIVLLSNATIKSYLPNLWRWNGYHAIATGYLNLESYVVGKGKNASLALSIILDALKDSESGVAVSVELKSQLDIVRANDAAIEPNSERAMERIFRNVSQLLRPHKALGRHNEMAYAMSEWCTILVADNDLSFRTIVNYIIDLDILHADVTSLAHCLLRRWPISPANMEDLITGRYFRRATTEKIARLWKDYRKDWVSQGRLLELLDSDIVPGHLLDLNEIVRQWHHDPRSITVDLRPKRHICHHHFREDDGMLAYDDIIHRLPVCTCRNRRYIPSRLANEPFLSPYWPHQAMIAPARTPSPIPIAPRVLPPTPLPIKPRIGRLNTFPGRAMILSQ
ncbi:MAG: hypothetical protein L6R41_000673 [Letrouitia leprolyta]|nr:MAG: hypothetical protein L6R41_000673 [Letrouitia leprolyta]